MWSPVTTTGSKPPPISEFSFLKVNDSTDIIFGGTTKYDFLGDSDELYTLDHKRMVCLYSTLFITQYNTSLINKGNVLL